MKKSEDGSDNKAHNIVKNIKSEDPRTKTIQNKKNLSLKEIKEMI